MEKDLLFGIDFLKKVVEWSELPNHSGKLFYSLEKDNDAVGYVSVGNDVIEYTKVNEEVAACPVANAAHLERLRSLICLPEQPHSSRIFGPQSALTRINKRMALRDRLQAIQERELQGSMPEEDPLEKCLSLQNAAAEDFCAQLSKFPNRIRNLSILDDGSVVLDFSRLPLLEKTNEAINSINFCKIPLLAGQEGLIFKFKYYSKRRCCFEK